MYIDQLRRQIDMLHSVSAVSAALCPHPGRFGVKYNSLSLSLSPLPKSGLLKVARYTSYNNLLKLVAASSRCQWMHIYVLMYGMNL